MKRDKANRLFIFVILMIVAVAMVIPYFAMLSNSFKTTKETLANPEHILPQEPTTEGYRKVLFEAPFFKWLGNSVFITVINTVTVLFTSSLLGYVFSKFTFKGKNALFMLLLSTMMVPAQTTMIPSFILINAIGLYDSPWALIIPAFISAFGIYLCKQFCDEIPRELMESAKMDGAGDMRIYFKIVLPQIRPAIGALGIFTFMGYWNDYLGPLIYLNSTERMTLPLALSYFSNDHAADLSAVMAAAALIMIPVTIVFILFQKQFIKGISMTGMK